MRPRAAILIVLLGSLFCRTAAPGPESASSARGSLLIVGGGPIPDAILSRFVALAGGSRTARILVFPMASEDKDAGIELVADFQKRGAQAQRFLLARPEAETEEMAHRLDEATGIWFGGGDQSRLTAVLAGTPLERAIRARYSAGAVIGGTSAGAAVMTTPMITGEEKHPGGSRPFADPNDSLSAFATIARDNVLTAAGFDLLPGAIIDQHFVRRRRANRLISLVLEHPDRIGAGIDESTAIEVAPDGRWRVLGESVVVVFDARDARMTPADAPLGAAGVRMHVIPAGGSFDPRTGRVRLPESRKENSSAQRDREQRVDQREQK